MRILGLVCIYTQTVDLIVTPVLESTLAGLFCVGNGENCARKGFHLNLTLGSSPEPSSEVVRANFQVETRVL